MMLKMTAIPPAILTALKTLLIKHEGYRRRVYVDTTGNITVGIGHNLSAQDVDDDIISRWFNEDVEYIYSKMHGTFSWFDELDDVRKIALLDMAFNLGFKGFCKFKRLIKDLAAKEYILASQEIGQSLYARQVGRRAHRIALMIATGKMP